MANAFRSFLEKLGLVAPEKASETPASAPSAPAPTPAPQPTPNAPEPEAPSIDAESSETCHDCKEGEACECQEDGSCECHSATEDAPQA